MLKVWKVFFKIVSIHFFLIRKERKSKFLGALWAPSSWLSSLAAWVGIRHNLNNIGNVYSIPKQDQNISQLLEKEVIEWNKQLIRTPNTIEGYLTSGGTESNLFLVWTGREWLRKRSTKKPVLLLTDLTHYSVRKAARITDLEELRIPVNEAYWGMDIEKFQQAIISLAKKSRPTLVCLTLGYSSIGTADDISAILKQIKHVQNLYPKFYCFVWVDAAMQGLAESFLDDSFKPFSDSLVQGYLVDFHKLGRSPLPSGVVLYRPELRELIETEIDYLKEKDATLSGSRPGFSALAIWANLMCKSNQDWKKIFERLQAKKDTFIKKIIEIDPTCKIINRKNSLTFGLIKKPNINLELLVLLKKNGVNAYKMQVHTTIQKSKVSVIDCDFFKFHFVSKDI